MIELVTERKASRFLLLRHARELRALAELARGVSARVPAYCGGEKLGYLWWDARKDVVHVDTTRALRLAIENVDQETAAMTGTSPQIGDAFISKMPDFTATGNFWYDYWPVSGDPDSGTYPGSANTASALSDLTTGAPPISGNVSPLVRQLVSVQGSADAGSVRIIIVDRALQYPSCPLTGALQNMTNTTPASRYIATGEPGLQPFCTLQSSAGIGGASNLSAVSYTNQSGATKSIQNTPLTLDAVDGGPNGTTFPACIATSSSAGTFPFMVLAPGDTGAQAILSYTTSAAVTGTLCFVLGYPIMFLSLPVAGFTYLFDTSKQLITRSPIKDGACLNVLYRQHASGSSTRMSLRLVYDWG